MEKKQILRRLMRSKSALFCTVLLAFFVFGAIVFPLISPFDYATQNVAFANQGPLFQDPISGSLHWFGTDSLGRDIFVRLWCGARVTFTVAVLVVLIDCIIGVIYGGIAGYIGGTLDIILMRILEIISGIPYLIIVLLMLVVFPRGLGTIILAYSLVGWTQMARLVRGQVIGLCKREFVITAKVMGAGPFRIIFRHLIPNLLPVIIVNVTLDIPAVIFTEAFLSMLGLGIAPPNPSLGVMANEGVIVFQTYPTQLICAASFICLTIFAFNLLGDKLVDALNPHQKSLGGNIFGKKRNLKNR